MTEQKEDSRASYWIKSGILELYEVGVYGDKLVRSETFDKLHKRDKLMKQWANDVANLPGQFYFQLKSA